MRQTVARVRRGVDAFVVAPLRQRWGKLLERGPVASERLYQGADAVANLPFRSDHIEPPSAFRVGDVEFDIVSELEAFTRLPREVIMRELATRRGLSFRAEWHSTPRHLRQDDWFYLSSKTYLFANAVHYPDATFVETFVRPWVPDAGSVLDFGAGTANIGLVLAAQGFDVWVAELNALQRDFIRFRVARHGLAHRVTIVEPWEQLPRGRFDAVVAVDVLEHLPDCQGPLERDLIPALTPAGILVENSPFVVNTANPMHHADFGFEDFMRGAGFASIAASDDGSRVWARSRP
jgi:2-polyprenyl-3-methyl-5-hydroxy-6-metoxy-1,4-benzoquinol methylase